MMEKTTNNITFHYLVKDFPFTNRSGCKAFLQALFRKEKKKLAQLNFIFCTDEYLLNINKTHLKHDYYTDIITFELSDPGAPVVGEIYISIDRVRDNAKSLGEPFKRELHRVIFHGALHLCDYGDKSPKEEVLMRKMEDNYLALYFA
ncbi:rRNA maturation RNase YbeY [Flavihumibacter fluvii]|uniref:rRNA maturation RNase YbeY n=1 Tax=Flavihumibacter fluvii TaxID=2838157 RepID=UPI001BDF64D5|nr:rRNA maturation RNase YbeY [Flavihumibacter fluvii]ULQ51684.1 rRNA maturation RNase YbeY [Flavihumibacter fluvii]